jgi:hypothetical protein
VTRRQITFVTRRACSLCEEALPGVADWAGRLGLEVEVVDVDAAGLADRYGNTVPVVLGNSGDVLLAGRWGKVRLAAAMLRARYG